jgi:transcriptional regulator with XRE-family HTH domain
MMSKQRATTTMTTALRKAIKESDDSFHELERQTGIKRQSLMKFARGEQSLRLDLADKLAEYFGLEVTKRKAK